MDLINKKIDIIVVTSKDGAMRPVRFRVEDGIEEQQVIQIKRLIYRDINKTHILFKCLIILNGAKKVCELLYSKSELKWTLNCIR